MATTINELKQRQDTKDAANAKLGESHEITDKTWEVSIPRTRICTLEQLIAHCEIDLSTWTVVRFTANKWETAAKDSKTDQIKVEPLFQIKAFLERKVELADARAEIEALVAISKEKVQTKWPAIVKPPSTGVMQEINLPDLHAGKYSWKLETGGPNYDIHIFREKYWKAFDALLSRTSYQKVERYLFNIGNDLFNSDDEEGRTTAGTYVSTDGRYQKTFEIVRDLKIESIKRLRAVAPVDVIVTRGNHDARSSWHLGDSLSMRFHGCPDVTINNLPRFRKYYGWGKVGLLFTHGHLGKLTDFPLLFAREMPDLWAATRFREVHCGHKHQKFVSEHHGVRVRIISALCPPDAWHAHNGFVGNLRCAETFLWHREEGTIGTAEYTDWEEGE